MCGCKSRHSIGCQRAYSAAKSQSRLTLQVQAITDYVAYPSVVGAETNVTDGSWTVSMEQQPLLFSLDMDGSLVDSYNGSVQVMRSLQRPCREILLCMEHSRLIFMLT